MRAFVNELRLGNFSELFVELNFAEFSFSAILRGCKKLTIALINFVCHNSSHFASGRVGRRREYTRFPLMREASAAHQRGQDQRFSGL